jgi:BASS family bile acid:Na+ symporter
MLSALIKERGIVADAFREVGLAALAFNLASMIVGYVIPRVVQVEPRQAVAIGMEIGIHNGTLAIAIASSPSLLNNPAMAIPPAIYSLIMFFTATAFGIYVARRAPNP